MRRKQLAAEVLYRLGVVHLAGWWQSLRGRGGPLFLMGHRVLPEAAGTDDLVDRMALISGHAITPRELRRRLRFVGRMVMPTGDPADLAAGLPAHRRYYLTFDDGYLDNLTYARAVLESLGVRAVIFFVGKLVERPTAVPWWDAFGGDALAGGQDRAEAMCRYSELCMKRKQGFVGLSEEDFTTTAAVRRYVSEAELASLPDTFYAANHTSSHADLSRLDATDIAREIDDGDAMVRKSSRYLPVLAFPFGYFGRGVQNWLEQSGRYRLAFATGNGIDGDPRCQRRINLNLRPFSLFAAHCVGLIR